MHSKIRRIGDFIFAGRVNEKYPKFGLVVQLVRMPACHAGGREFESRPDRTKQPLNLRGCFAFCQMRFFVYILYSCSTDKFYKGQTHNVIVRLKQHNDGQEFATRNGRPWKLIWLAEKSSRAEAMKLERKLKNLSRVKLFKFMAKYQNQLFDPLLLKALTQNSSSQ